MIVTDPYDDNIVNGKDALFEQMRTLLAVTKYSAPDYAWAVRRDTVLQNVNRYMSRGSQ